MADDKATTEATTALEAVAASVTGPGTPNVATVKTAPDKSARWALILAGPAISAMLVGCIWVLSWKFWPDVVKWREPNLGEKIILGVSSVAMVLAILLGLVVFRLASGGLKSVSAKALGGSLEIDTGAHADDGP